MVDAFLPSGAFQIVIGHIRPPCGKLFLTVPAFGDRILSAVSSGFRMLVCADKSLCLGSGWRHIDLLFADLVGILLLPYQPVSGRIVLGGLVDQQQVDVVRIQPCQYLSTASACS